MKFLRARNVTLFGGALLALLLMIAVDPDTGWVRDLPIGVGAVMAILSLTKFFLALILVHFGRKALHDYPEADARMLFAKASESPVGAGIAILALAVVAFGLMGLFGKAFAQDVRTYIPPQAHQWRPHLVAEYQDHWPDHPAPHIIPALIEHESCISLTHSRCWNPKSRLKSAREEGAGLGQITRAYRADGSLRFDALAEMRATHPSLQSWSWSNVYDRPDLQIRAVVLKLRGDYFKFPTAIHPEHRLAFTDAAYNGGYNGLHRERTACSLREWCDPLKWWGNVEKLCLKSLAPLYSGRSACDINRHHVNDVLRVRSNKYRGWM